MGVLLAIPLFLACIFVPPILILRSKGITGWNKVWWVIGSLFSFVLPFISQAIAIVIAVNSFGYDRTLKNRLLGPEASFSAVANVLSLLLPWGVYFLFKLKSIKRTPNNEINRTENTSAL